MPKITVNFTPGDEVQQKLKPFTGEVKQTRLNDNGTPEYLVAYIDPETGDNDERWFTDAEIESV